MATKYTAADITVLEGLEPVRKRPGMYIGGVDSRGLHHLVNEIVDNAVDEVINGYATRLEVRLFPDGREIEISDNGKGFAVPADWLSMVREGHYGLAGMAERVSAAGGKLEIVSQPGAQTTVRAVIPCGQV